MATPHEMKTWRRPTKRPDDSSVRGFDRLVDLRKPTPPTRTPPEEAGVASCSTAKTAGNGIVLFVGCDQSH